MKLQEFKKNRFKKKKGTDRQMQHSNSFRNSSSWISPCGSCCCCLIRVLSSSISNKIWESERTREKQRAGQYFDRNIKCGLVGGARHHHIAFKPFKFLWFPRFGHKVLIFYLMLHRGFKTYTFRWGHLK